MGLHGDRMVAHTTLCIGLSCHGDARVFAATISESGACSQDSATIDAMLRFLSFSAFSSKRLFFKAFLEQVEKRLLIFLRTRDEELELLFGAQCIIHAKSDGNDDDNRRQRQS
jgi:hypothetical protein